MTDLRSAVPGLLLPAETSSETKTIEREAWALPVAVLAGGLFGLIGAAFVVLGLEYRLGTLRSMGPGMFPVAGGLLLVALGVALAVTGRRAAERFGGIGLRPLAAIIGSVALFAALVERAGLAIAAPLLVAGVVIATGQGSWKFALAIAVPLTLAAIVIFPTLLGVPLKVLA